ncbi:internalin A [Vigna unguiculata]|uniref:Internalin A n=2 Tax=Vigna unguiculata TaxID=3917 RepID=A0A4D6MNT3_VIGUN|nr:internalin A [Vigna unguiculata]
MDFSYNQCITEIPDVSELQNLREMRLDHCRNLIAVHESVGVLKRLAHLNLSECRKLQNFMSRMFLPSLEIFNLNFCESLGHFPEIMKEMTKPLKIYMTNTGIQELPESVSKLTGLVSLDISNNRELKYLPSSLFMLPNVDSFIIKACSKLGESFRSLVQHPSKANVHPKLRILNLENGNLSDEDLLAILCHFRKLEELIVSENNFVCIPSCIKECGDLTSLDLNGCKKLKKIPELTGLRILDVHDCIYLEEISELPSTVQKVDARFCFNLTRETSDMLWSQVKKAEGGIEMVMPFISEIPEWFNYVGVERIPRFWVRGKFPNIVVAMIFHFKNERERYIFGGRGLVDLRLLINGRYAPRKGYQNFQIEEEHILVCDVGALCSEKEWVGDAVMEHEWNLVQVAYDATSSLMISGWGAFVYEEKEGRSMEDILFACPNNLIVNGDSTCVVKGSVEEDENYVPVPEGVAWELLFEGIKDGIVEAWKMFPSLDIAEVFGAVMKKNGRIEWTAEGMEGIPSAENRTYFTGLYGALLEANRRFPDLDVGATLSTVANRKGIKGDFKTPLQEKMRIPHLDWTTVTLPPSHDPLMQIYMMMMKQQSSSESELKTKTLWKLKESHQVLRNGLALRENAAQNAPSCSKNRYDELIQKFHIQYDAFVGKRVDRVYGVAKYEKDSVVLKERVREIERVFNGVVERLQNSEEFEDVMTAMFLNGLRDGVLEARAILLALCTHTQAHERVTDEATNNQNIS